MSSTTDTAREPRSAETEPWRPIETKLVGWSLGIGVGLLIVLALVNRILPATF
jgi:hypothetical protein